MKTRLLHLAMLAIGAAIIVLTALEKLPKYAAFAGFALGAIAEAKKAFPVLDPNNAKAAVVGFFALLATRAVAIVVGIFLVASLVVSCAHLTAIKNACEPTRSEATAVAANLSKDNYEALLEQFGIDHTICVVNAAVQEFLASRSSDADATTAKAAEDVSVVHGRAWLAKHGS